MDLCAPRIPGKIYGYEHERHSTLPGGSASDASPSALGAAMRYVTSRGAQSPLLVLEGTTGNPWSES